MADRDGLAQLVNRGVESKDVEYKGPMEWDETDKRACCELVKDILAIANTKGGFVIVGVSEADDGSFQPDGLTRAQSVSFESTRLANFVQRYADPPINVTARVIKFEGKAFVAIQIPGFPNEPHICIKDFPGVLSTPTIYTRNDNIESAPLSKAIDLQALVSTAVRNRSDELLSSVRAIITGATSTAGRTDVDHFEEQFMHALSALVDKNAYPDQDYTGFREVYAYPSEFDGRRFDINKIKTATDFASVNYRGLPFLFVANPADLTTYRLQDGYETYFTLKDFHAHNMLDFWRLRTSGSFFHRRLMWEEDEGRQQGVGPALDIIETVYHSTEALDAIVRLYRSLGVMDDEAITVRVRYLGTRDRRLMAFNDPISLRMNWVCQIPEVKIQMSMSLAEWVAGQRDLAGEITASIFHMFNWEDASPDTYRKEIEKLLDRRR